MSENVSESLKEIEENAIKGCTVKLGDALKKLGIPRHWSGNGEYLISTCPKCKTKDKLLIQCYDNHWKWRCLNEDCQSEKKFFNNLLGLIRLFQNGRINVYQALEELDEVTFIPKDARYRNEIFVFGNKWLGKKFHEIKVNYLKWYLTLPHTDEKLRDSVNQYLYGKCSKKRQVKYSDTADCTGQPTIKPLKIKQVDFESEDGIEEEPNPLCEYAQIIEDGVEELRQTMSVMVENGETTQEELEDATKQLSQDCWEDASRMILDNLGDEMAAYVKAENLAG